jgi:DNA-directed RNA polymerase sigma subunit (sigma70/sigma32)
MAKYQNEGLNIIAVNLGLIEINKRLVEYFLKFLNERELFVIKSRFGLDGFESQSLKMLGTQIKNLQDSKKNIKKERVRQIEAKALRKMRIKFIQM